MTFAPPFPRERYWEIRPGDTLHNIAQRLGTTIAQLRRLNPELDPHHLGRIHHWIRVPYARPWGGCRIFWTVRPGDSFHTMARAIGLPMREIQRVNPGVNSWNLWVGQQVCLPS